MEELNKKLAEWRFGENMLDYTPLGAVGEKVWAWVKWEGVGQPLVGVTGRRKPIPIDFPHNLNACFKWLVPEARRKFKLSKIEFCYSLAGYICGIKLHRHFIEGLVIYAPLDESELEATWLCRAIEKLIDGFGEKDV